jgi:Cu+-exporting ATPase
MPRGITLLTEKENAMTPSEKVTTHFQIDGMTCGHCASTIEKALRSSLPAVEPVLEVASKRLVATFDPAQIAVSQIVSVVSEAGYEAKPL